MADNHWHLAATGRATELAHEVERLRAALSDVATFVSAPRPAAMSELDWAYCNLSTMQSYAREALGVNEQQAPRRSLSDSDAFCPSCGHNRDKSSVSSIDHGGFKSCQKCGATWTEIDTEQQASEPSELAWPIRNDR